MDWIIEKAVELGIAEVFPLLTERTIIRLNAAEASEKQEKWQRSALEACKQCGQTWLPKIHAPQPWKAFLAHLPDTDFRLIAALLPESRKWADLPKNTGKSVLLTIGPEGDFSAAEYRQALEHAFQPWSLGEIILRTETASLYCLSVLRHELGD
jgi:16S rRNA (uracil1498-N3)-methyltransferase